MNYHRRRQFYMIFAIVAALAASAKVFKAFWRGETTQSRVKPL